MREDDDSLPLSHDMVFGKKVTKLKAVQKELKL